ncbi:unnamed protein product [Caenorhabditis angaria]|uniref:PWWP domain-containing protein n=1 Tax=Caenorhabditis angaria TaxID=860376 RepID=A0A9P1I449_9PELO|nr:unnamed protein product [Caenorhabditis angaria]
MDEPSSSTNFQPGDLLWAKMKGFPPWPAKVLEMTVETPARRIPVMFFGTLETSFMKPADLSDYMSFRKEYEIARKQKDFNKAVREIRRAAGLSSEQDESAFPVSNSKSPPSSPRASSSVMINTESKRKRSNSASTKSRSRASSTASVYRTMKDLFKKDRRRLDSESSHGSKRKMISGMGAGQGSEVYEQYADSTDFNALFGDAFINDLGTIPDDNKSWKSKRSRGSSKIFDDLLYGTHRTRNRSGSASGRRSRLISMSGFSGVSDVFDDFFNNHVDLDVQAEQLMHTLNNMPSDGSIDRPLSPELAPTMPAPVEFCSSCGFECRLYNGVLRCNHCSKYKEAPQATSSTVRDGDDSRNKLNIPLSLNIKTESVSSGEKFINNMLMARPADKTPEKGLKSVKQEASSPAKQKRSNLVINIKHEDSDDSYRKEQKKKRKVQLMSPRSPNMISIPSETANIPTGGDTLLSGRTSRDRSRPKHYGYSKVEKTPPISASGHRHCVNCNGQVRPQMCGGNRHRWRCVDKKCRKWYGWVRSHEEIPKNVGRKKVGVKQPQIAVKPQKVKKKEEPEEENPLLKRKVGRPSKNDIKIRLKLQKEQAAAALVARSAIQPQISSSSDPNGLQRRKYTKRKMKDGTTIMGTNGGGGNMKKEYSPFEEDVKKRSCSPLNEKEASYRPCAMEKRARWWTGEKRRVDVSPERELGTTAADTAAAFRMMAHAVRSAAVTRADEVGTVNGSLDLLMDTLVGSMAPLLSLLQNVPAFQIDPELSQQMWNSSAIHIPTFQ